jgi:predicted transcriptional regulator
MEARPRYHDLDQHKVNQAVYRLAPTGAQEVADLLGVSRQAVDRRLRQLEDDGAIWSKKVGPTRVWLHPWVLPEPGWEPSRIQKLFGFRRRFGTSSRSTMGGFR